jgi:hypothetical protein
LEVKSHTFYFTRKLQADQELLWSPVVANCRMNRERVIAGANSYARELKLDIVDFLTEKARQGITVHWLDICCGSGKALLQAAMLLREKGVGTAPGSKAGTWPACLLRLTLHRPVCN